MTKAEIEKMLRGCELLYQIYYKKIIEGDWSRIEEYDYFENLRNMMELEIARLQKQLKEVQGDK